MRPDIHEYVKNLYGHELNQPHASLPCPTVPRGERRCAAGLGRWTGMGGQDTGLHLLCTGTPVEAEYVAC